MPPHIHAEDRTRSMMLDVLIALLPAAILAVFTFGPRALAQIAVGTASCVFFEWLYRRLAKKPPSTDDLSAAVTGVLLSFTLPVSVPLWIPVVGALAAIVIAKQLYGGIGKNLFNPALMAHVALLLCWPSLMTAWTVPGARLPFFRDAGEAAQAAAAATPLSILRQGGSLAGTDLFNMLFGQTAGPLGGTSAVALLIGAVYLLYRRVVTVRIPLSFLGTVALLTLLFPGGSMPSFRWMLCELASGGLMLGALFMATDCVTSPVTPRGQWIYGAGCGLLTVFLRYFGSYTEGVGFAILLMNALTWILDRHGMPRRFGAETPWQRALVRLRAVREGKK